MKYFHSLNEKVSTELATATKPGDKIIRTKDWGDFKVRKNGRITVKIGDEIVRVTPFNKSTIKKRIKDLKKM